MSKFSTLHYLFNSYYAGKKEVEMLHDGACSSDSFDTNISSDECEPSQICISAILNFASQYEVLESKITGNVELNLN